MKKKIVAFLSLTILLASAACSSAAATSTSAGENTGPGGNPPNAGDGVGPGAAAETTNKNTNNTRLNENYTDALPVVSQLMVGTLMLESTENAITDDQVENLVFLWKGIKYLQNNSGTAASEETDAVIEQLQSSMTSEQIKAISAMKLTQTDVQSAIQQYGSMAMDDEEDDSMDAEMIRMGAAMGGGGPGGGGGGGMPGGGGPPAGGGGGGMGGDMGGMMGGQAPEEEDGDAMATVTSDPRLLNAVIKFLENKLID